MLLMLTVMFFVHRPPVVILQGWTALKWSNVALSPSPSRRKRMLYVVDFCCNKALYKLYFRWHFFFHLSLNHRMVSTFLPMYCRLTYCWFLFHSSYFIAFDQHKNIWWRNKVAVNLIHKLKSKKFDFSDFIHLCT